MITLKIVGVKELKKALGPLAEKKLNREVSRAINKTADKVKTNVSKLIRTEVAIAAASVKSRVRVKPRASQRRLSATFQLDKSSRPSLASYGAKQNTKGVSFRISKKSGRKTIKGGFMGSKPGIKEPKLLGHAFIRKGRGREPKVILRGVSPFAVFTKNNMLRKTIADGDKELKVQINRRIEYALADAKKQAGGIV